MGDPASAAVGKGDLVNVEHWQVQATLPAGDQDLHTFTIRHDPPDHHMAAGISQLTGSLARAFSSTGIVAEPCCTRLFERAMELKIPHNYFATWMVTRCSVLRNQRPVGLLTAQPNHRLLLAGVWTSVHM